MSFSKSDIHIIRVRFPVGTRIELIEMDDPQAPPPHTQGTVQYVDDIGTIFVKWDNGSQLGVILECDIVKKLE